MHRALLLPDIFLVILSLLYRQDNARCARVCKFWSDAALDEVWREVNIFELLQVLGLKSDRKFLVSLHRMISNLMANF